MSKRVKDLGSLVQEIFADAAKAIRVSEASCDFQPKGAVGTSAVRTGANASVVFYNPTGAVVFVAFGDQSMAAPTSAADGFPVLAGEKARLNSGEFSYARASATGLFWYAGDQE